MTLAERPAATLRYRFPVVTLHRVWVCAFILSSTASMAQAATGEGQPPAILASLLSAVELCPRWAYALSLYHGGAPPTAYGAALSAVQSDVLRDRLLHADRLPRDVRFLRAAVVSLIERDDIDAAGLFSEIPEDRQLAMADALSQAGRLECIPIYEGLLESIEGEGGEGRAPALAGLAFFYKRSRQYEKAFELFANADRYTSSEFVIADYRLEAARLARTALRQPVLARKLYEEFSSERSDTGWIAGAALLDQARSLYARGQFAEAREVLDREITGYRATEAGIALDLMRGKIAWAEGDHEAALSALTRVMERCGARTTVRPELATWRAEAAEGMRLLQMEDPRSLSPLGPVATVVLRTGWDGSAEGSTELTALHPIQDITLDAPPGLATDLGGWYRRGFLYRAVVRVIASSNYVHQGRSGAIRIATSEMSEPLGVPLEMGL